MIDSMDTRPNEFQLPFVKKEQVSSDAYTFYFDRKAFPAFSFLPGQWIRTTLPIAEPDDRGNSRSFSISSSPLNTQFLTITTRVIQSAFKKTLVNLPQGIPVQFFGPAGRF